MSVKLVDEAHDPDVGTVSLRGVVNANREPTELTWFWKHDFPLTEKAINHLRSECIAALYDIALEQPEGQKVGFFIEFTKELNDDCTN